MNDVAERVAGIIDVRPIEVSNIFRKTKRVINLDILFLFLRWRILTIILFLFGI